MRAMTLDITLNLTNDIVIEASQQNKNATSP